MRPGTLPRAGALVLAGAGLALVGLALLVRGTEPVRLPEAPSIRPTPAPAATPAHSAPESPRVARTPPAAPPDTAAPPPAPVSADPVLRRWQASIRRHDRQGVLDSQAIFLAREGEYREPLVQMAREDPEPRNRAFSISVLSRMKAPPPESFFRDCLGDAEEYPRTSALGALERLGSLQSLEAIDRLASSDASAPVREAASQAAKAVRAR